MVPDGASQMMGHSPEAPPSWCDPSLDLKTRTCLLQAFMQKQQQRRVAPRPGEHGGGADAAPAAGADEALQVLHSVEAPARASADAAAAQRPKLLPEEVRCRAWG
jgi:hypothetical protein